MKEDNCIICGEETTYFLSRIYPEPYDKLLEKSDFFKCSSCGFTNSDTIFKMADEVWNKLNYDFHIFLETQKFEEDINQPPYIQQALMFKVLVQNGLIKEDGIVDYAGGKGTLSKLVRKYLNLEIPIYDPYVKDTDDSQLTYVESPKKGEANTLINSALFEHIRNRSDLEHVNELLSDDGVLILHTLICENIPKDPNWFYLVPPVHSALHTNKSMQILMDDWNFVSSIYCPVSKCWVLFKKEPARLEDAIKLINKEFQTNYFVYKKGFVDYWKGF